MTSFERPVVPDVGIITAVASWSMSAGPRPSAAAVKRSAAVTVERSSSGARSGSVTTSVGSTWSTKPASSAAVLFGLTGTWVAPTSIRASHVSRWSGWLRGVCSTRSPGRTPADRRADAARSMRSWASA